ncbi:hypothetical protein QBC32DRAFT_317886 [Pseudoneurospora amorphoporcata]|uniref:Uncharacterized protein n=1 Tax=Pseudoneurospora amorphoporcata TaxID=241081 RepID=A0AAN6NM41_9PEZI|nr:hypothetical protein QBC32DRAFT_317886 [Pseudoneurospora amorphoporcata]
MSLSNPEAVYLNDVRQMAPESPVVRAHEEKQARINALQEEIIDLRVVMRYGYKRVSEIAKGMGD